VTESPPDLVEHPLASLVLGGVVQERCDRLVLVAAVLDHERADPEQVADVGDAASLSHLRPMSGRREPQCLLEALAEDDRAGALAGEIRAYAATVSPRARPSRRRLAEPVTSDRYRATRMSASVPAHVDRRPLTSTVTRP
jgi:hypothetical protein